MNVRQSVKEFYTTNYCIVFNVRKFDKEPDYDLFFL